MSQTRIQEQSPTIILLKDTIEKKNLLQAPINVNAFNQFSVVYALSIVSQGRETFYIGSTESTLCARLRDRLKRRHTIGTVLLVFKQVNGFYYDEPLRLERMLQRITAGKRLSYGLTNVFELEPVMNCYPNGFSYTSAIDLIRDCLTTHEEVFSNFESLTTNEIRADNEFLKSEFFRI